MVIGGAGRRWSSSAAAHRGLARARRRTPGPGRGGGRGRRRGARSWWPSTRSVFAHPPCSCRSAEQSASFRDNDGAGYLYVPFHLVAQFPLLLQGLVRRRPVGRGHGSSPRLAPRPRRGRPGWPWSWRRWWRCPLRRGREELRPLQRPPPAPVRLAGVGGAGHPGAGARCSAWARTRGRSAWSVASPLVALVAPVADQATLFPYQYSYFNLALDATGAHVDVRLLADQRARAAAGHPDRRPDRLRPDPVDPARSTAGQRRGATASTRRRCSRAASPPTAASTAAPTRSVRCRPAGPRGGCRTTTCCRTTSSTS